MATPKSIVRQSISLPVELADQIQTLAKSKRLSSSCMLLELVEEGLTSKKREQKFFALAERFRSTTDEKKVQQLGNELGRMVFGG